MDRSATELRGAAGMASRGARVAAVVVTHNGQRFLSSCLRSLLDSTPGLEVMLVDNASTDGTADLARREFSGIGVFAVARNLGYGRAINLAAQQNAAEYLAILNQDVVSRPDWIQRLVEALEADQSAALATPLVLL